MLFKLTNYVWMLENWLFVVIGNDWQNNFIVNLLTEFLVLRAIKETRKINRGLKFKDKWEVRYMNNMQMQFIILIYQTVLFS